MAAPSTSNQRPIIIRKVRKVAHAAHHGGAWKVAYADFVTAMMAFFMLLWLIANPDKVRLKGLAAYFSPSPPNESRSTTMTAIPGDSPGLGGQGRRAQADNMRAKGQPAAGGAAVRSGTAAIPDASLRVIAEEMRVSIDAASDPEAKNNIKIEEDRDGLRITLMDSGKRSMFREGTSVLNDFAKVLLERVADRLRRSSTQFAIEGHTDSSGGQSEANWRLSGERALAARAALIKSGITADRFAEVVAMAGSRPVYPGQPERPENRRITIIALASVPALPSDTSFQS